MDPTLRALTAVILAAALPLAGPSAPGAAQGRPQGPAVLQVLSAVPGWEGQLVDQVSGRRAYQHVLELSQKIGPHVAGEPADRTSGAYIAEQLTRDGYAVAWQAFPFPYFAVRAESLVVPSSPTVAWHPRAMMYSPSTPSGGLTADVIDAGAGRPDDLQHTAVSGKIALIERGGLTFRQKVENVAAAGAVAAVIYNNQGGALGATLVRPTRIPAVSLSGAEGQKLLALVRAGTVAAHLTVQTANEERTSWNIVGTKPGRDPHRVLIVGAHRDTVEAAPGANDNTSGVATALELAEVLRTVPLGVTLRFVFFGAEEEGLFGSDYYVQHPGPDPIIGMVNLDMEGVGARLEAATYRGNDTLVRTAVRLAGDLGIKVSASQSDGSDHVNFERIGVPVVFLFRPDDPDYDTPRDTVDRVDPALLEASARLALAIVLDVAGPGR
jgi:aminopeptidase YwaD